MTLLVGSIFHMTRKIVSEMTYNVSMGTLNPTIPYQLKQINVESDHETVACLCIIRVMGNCALYMAEAVSLMDSSHDGIAVMFGSHCGMQMVLIPGIVQRLLWCCFHLLISIYCTSLFVNGCLSCMHSICFQEFILLPYWKFRTHKMWHCNGLLWNA